MSVQQEKTEKQPLVINQHGMFLDKESDLYIPLIELLDELVAQSLLSRHSCENGEIYYLFTPLAASKEGKKVFTEIIETVLLAKPEVKLISKH